MFNAIHMLLYDRCYKSRRRNNVFIRCRSNYQIQRMLYVVWTSYMTSKQREHPTSKQCRHSTLFPRRYPRHLPTSAQPRRCFVVGTSLSDVGTTQRVFDVDPTEKRHDPTSEQHRQITSWPTSKQRRYNVYLPVWLQLICYRPMQ